MTRMKLLFVALAVLAGMSMVPMANAQSACPATPGHPCLHYAASGSSGMFQQFGASTINDVTIRAPQCSTGINVVGGCAIHHFSIKGSCADSIEPGTPCVGIVDGRNHAIPVETATFWTTWVCPVTALGPQADCNGTNATDVWFYDQVDSTVGIRTFLGQATTVIAGNTTNGGDPAGNLLPAVLLQHGDATGACGGPTTCDAASIPADVWNAINNSILNTGMTDIRPEDGKYATERDNAVSTLSPWNGLGYGGGPNTLIGASIASAFTQTFATPVSFGLPGTNDPFTNAAVPNTITVLAVGESPIVFVVNRRDANGLGYIVPGSGKPWYNNAVDNASLANPYVYTQSPIGLLFGGDNCSGSGPALGNYPPGVGPFTHGLPTGLADFAVNPILRESLSGTENTTEFGAFRTYGGNLATVGGSSVSNSNVNVTTSQEAKLVAVAGNAPVNPLGGPQAANPPGTPCTTNGGSGLGKRYRSVGSGEEVGKSSAVCATGFTGVGCVQDSIGYAFFSFGNVNPLANSNYGYLQFDGVDPIFNSYAGGDPGQPASGGAEQGQLPVCNASLDGTVGSGCETTDVWTNGKSFPHLRDGTYRVWSLLRALCDTNAADAPMYGAGHCTYANDPLGTEAVIAAAQDDVHTNSNTSVADFLPFNDGSLGVVWNQPYGDASYIRSHYAFQSSVGVANNQYPNQHITPAFSIFPNGLNADQANGTGGSPEAGGDAGGCIIPAAAPDKMAITGAFGTNPSTVGGTNYTKMKLNYTALSSSGQVPLTGVCGPGSGAGFTGQPCISSFLNSASSGTTTVATPGVNCGNTVGTCNPPANNALNVGGGLSVSVTGFTGTNNNDNGTFQVTRILYDGQIKVRYEPAVTGMVKTVTAAAQGTANMGCSQ